MKQGEIIKAAFVLDEERDRRYWKVLALEKQLAREKEAFNDIKETRKILSAYIFWCEGRGESESFHSYPGWEKVFDRISVACGGKPGEWLSEDEPQPAQAEPKKDLLDPKRVLMTASLVFINRGNQRVAEVLADIGHCRGVEPYDVGREPNE